MFSAQGISETIQDASKATEIANQQRKYKN
jgi:hypothetical protein